MKMAYPEILIDIMTNDILTMFYTFFLAFELSWITSDQRVVGLGLLKSCLMALAKTSALPLQSVEHADTLVNRLK